MFGDDAGGEIPGPDTQTKPHTSQSVPSNQNQFRKLFTSERPLIVRMKRFCEAANECRSQQQINACSEALINIQSTFNQFKRPTNEITDSDLVVELVEQVDDQLENCTKLYQSVKQHLSSCASKKPPKELKCDEDGAELNPADSVSEVTDWISIYYQLVNFQQTDQKLTEASFIVSQIIAS